MSCNDGKEEGEILSDEDSTMWLEDLSSNEEFVSSETEALSGVVKPSTGWKEKENVEENIKRRCRRKYSASERFKSSETQCKINSIKSKELPTASKDSLVTSRELSDSLKVHPVRSKHLVISPKEPAVRTKESLLHVKDALTQSKDISCRSKGLLVRSKDATVQSKDPAVRSKVTAVRSKETTGKSKQFLSKSSEPPARSKKTNASERKGKEHKHFRKHLYVNVDAPVTSLKERLTNMLQLSKPISTASTDDQDEAKLLQIALNSLPNSMNTLVEEDEENVSLLRRLALESNTKKKEKIVNNYVSISNDVSLENDELTQLRLQALQSTILKKHKARMARDNLKKEKAQASLNVSIQGDRIIPVDMEIEETDNEANIISPEQGYVPESWSPLEVEDPVDLAEREDTIESVESQSTYVGQSIPKIITTRQLLPPQPPHPVSDTYHDLQTLPSFDYQVDQTVSLNAVPQPDLVSPSPYPNLSRPLHFNSPFSKNNVGHYLKKRSSWHSNNIQSYPLTVSVSSSTDRSIGNKRKVFTNSGEGPNKKQRIVIQLGDDSESEDEMPLITRTFLNERAFQESKPTELDFNAKLDALLKSARDNQERISADALNPLSKSVFEELHANRKVMEQPTPLFTSPKVQCNSTSLVRKQSSATQIRRQSTVNSTNTHLTPITQGFKQTVPLVIQGHKKSVPPCHPGLKQSGPSANPKSEQTSSPVMLGSKRIDLLVIPASKQPSTANLTTKSLVLINNPFGLISKQPSTITASTRLSPVILASKRPATNASSCLSPATQANMRPTILASTPPSAILANMRRTVPANTRPSSTTPAGTRPPATLANTRPPPSTLANTRRSTTPAGTRPPATLANTRRSTTPAGTRPPTTLANMRPTTLASTRPPPSTLANTRRSTTPAGTRPPTTLANTQSPPSTLANTRRSTTPAGTRPPATLASKQPSAILASSQSAPPIIPVNNRPVSHVTAGLQQTVHPTNPTTKQSCPSANLVSKQLTSITAPNSKTRTILSNKGTVLPISQASKMPAQITLASKTSIPLVTQANRQAVPVIPASNTMTRKPPASVTPSIQPTPTIQQSVSDTIARNQPAPHTPTSSVATTITSSESKNGISNSTPFLLKKMEAKLLEDRTLCLQNLQTLLGQMNEEKEIQTRIDANNKVIAAHELLLETARKKRAQDVEYHDKVLGNLANAQAALVTKQKECKVTELNCVAYGSQLHGPNYVLPKKLTCEIGAKVREVEGRSSVISSVLCPFEMLSKTGVCLSQDCPYSHLGT